MTRATSDHGVVPVIQIHQRLAIARQFVGLNQSELAHRLGVTTSTIQRAETGVTTPRRTTLMAWSFATGVSLHWLETGESPRPEPDPDGGEECPQQGSNLRPADYQVPDSSADSPHNVIPLLPRTTPSEAEEVAA